MGGLIGFGILFVLGFGFVLLIDWIIWRDHDVDVDSE